MALVSVPPIDFREEYWGADNDGAHPRTAVAGVSGSYRSAFPARIRHLEVPVPSDLAALVSDAAVALISFSSHVEAALGRTPLVGPMSAILLRTEASSSSQIENLTVVARQLALAMLGKSHSTNAHLVVKNVRAMERALDQDAAASETAILAIHHELLRDDPYLAEHAGQYRKELVWVGGSSISPREANFVAPEPDLVIAAMNDLVQYMRRADLSPLVQAAIAHAQFETIHPLVDGNGRVGRTLVHKVLKNGGVLGGITAPISAGLLRSPAGYIQALEQYRQGNASPIIAEFARASLFAAHSGRHLVGQLNAELERARGKLVGLRSDATAWRVLPLLVANPLVNSALLQDQLNTNPRTALAALDVLERHGILTERTGLRRSRLWQHDGILALLDDYAKQVRRS